VPHSVFSTFMIKWRDYTAKNTSTAGVSQKTDHGVAECNLLRVPSHASLPACVPYQLCSRALSYEVCPNESGSAPYRNDVLLHGFCMLGVEIACANNTRTRMCKYCNAFRDVNN
jgi:hypothetical protein